VTAVSSIKTRRVRRRRQDDLARRRADFF
jgi:hypothetical protein